MVDRRVDDAVLVEGVAAGNDDGRVSFHDATLDMGAGADRIIAFPGRLKPGGRD